MSSATCASRRAALWVASALWNTTACQEAREDGPQPGITGGSGAESSGPGDPDGSGSDGGPSSGGTGEDGGPTGGSGGSGDETGDDGGIRLDVSGDSGGGGESGARGCEKVDFLFVIDSSASMQDEQRNLFESFPGFISAIENSLELTDFHLMVVEAGTATGTGCDGTLGAGRTRDASGNDCGLPPGQRFATQDQNDLIDTFECIGAVGIDGAANEQTMDATVAAIGPLAAPGACNEGFLRDDALLVVTIISDEEDGPADPMSGMQGVCAGFDDDANSTGDPTSWAATLQDAKNGDPGAVVVLVLVGDCDTTGTCEPMRTTGSIPAGTFGVIGAEPAPRLRELAGSFSNGAVGPVCAPDYAPFFSDATMVVKTACDDFVPPG